MSFATILKNPANKALLISPELWVGLIVFACIIYFGGCEGLLKAQSATGSGIDTEIKSLKTELDGKKQFSATLKKLETSGKQASFSFLSVDSPELLSVTLFDFINSVKGKINANLLSLPAPHNQLALLSLDEKKAAGTTAGATAEAGPAKLELQDIKNAPFKFDEAITLKEAKLSTYSADYTLKVKGSYAGLLSFLNTLLSSSPVVSLNAVNFTLDGEAPSLATFRPGTKLLPPPTASTSIAGSTGATSGSGGGNSVLSLGTTAINVPDEAKATTAKVGGVLPPSAAPVIMTVDFRVYIKEKAASATAPCPISMAPPSAMPAPANGMPSPPPVTPPTP